MINHGKSGYTKGRRCETCKTDHTNYHREWRHRPGNLEKVAATKRKARINNPERVREVGRRSYTKHRDSRLVSMRNNHLKRNYGITQTQYELLAQHQGNKCAICGKRSTGAKNFHVDHDHATGKIRQLLCNTCNSQLGWYETNKVIVDSCLQTHSGLIKG